MLSFSLWREAWLIVECGIERLFRHSHLSPLSKIGSSQTSLHCVQCSHPVCHWSFRAYLFLLFGPAPMICSTAPIERASPLNSTYGNSWCRALGARNQHGCRTISLHRGLSASTKTGLAAPYSCFFCPILLSVPFHNRTMLSLCLNQISALTTIENTRNSCRCSFTIATTGNSPNAASAPPDE